MLFLLVRRRTSRATLAEGPSSSPATGLTPTTQAVDIAPDGTTFPANRAVISYDVSADGRSVVFDLLTPE